MYFPFYNPLDNRLLFLWLYNTRFAHTCQVFFYNYFLIF